MWLAKSAQKRSPSSTNFVYGWLIATPLAKYLAAVIDPVLQLYSNNRIKDTFRCKIFKCIQKKHFFTHSTFAVSSFFTNVPSAETIQTCADALYGGEFIPPDYPKEIFVELMNTAIKSVEFSFYNNMYKQMDGVAIGSPLSVAQANIFVGYHENKLFESTTKPFLYHRYVDDTFAIFGPEDECTSFLDVLNSMHSALKFTFEKEENDQHPLLDVLVEKSNEGLNAKSLAPLVSTVIMQSDSIYQRIKNVPNITTIDNFPFWLQQDLRSIYQFWKQPTSIPHSLFFAVKKNSFIHSKFHINFFCAHFRLKRNNIFPPIKSPK